LAQVVLLTCGINSDAKLCKLMHAQGAHPTALGISLTTDCTDAVLCRSMKLEEEEDFTSSANQLGCTDVPGLSITWSKTSAFIMSKQSEINL